MLTEVNELRRENSRLKSRLHAVIDAAQVVLDQIESAGNVPTAAAFDGRELRNLRDVIAGRPT